MVVRADDEGLFLTVDGPVHIVGPRTLKADAARRAQGGGSAASALPSSPLEVSGGSASWRERMDRVGT